MQLTGNVRLVVRATLYGQDKAVEGRSDKLWIIGGLITLSDISKKRDVGHPFSGREGSLFVLGFEPACLHAIAADVHVTPATGVILAGIEKEPAAVGLLAGAKAPHMVGEHEVPGAEGERPERQIGRAFGFRPVPFEARSGPDHMLAGASLPETSLDDFNLRGGGTSIIDCSIEDFRRGLAQFAAGDQGICGRTLIGGTNDLPDLSWSEDLRLRRETKQVVVAGEQLLGAILAEAPVEGIDQVESRMTGDEFKGVSCFIRRHRTIFLFGNR